MLSKEIIVEHLNQIFDDFENDKDADIKQYVVMLCIEEVERLFELEENS